ncbi:hypothetical protein HHK36_021933 [Tetracentron sinense]|uniref:Uncharacterized protein n=1 Tax=Tetracentron sinense TaxID=13715 RepID=A0A834YW50_TETSI|nr:hypothetical protein HHK36_021933 [Tetracentron sinense]
MLLLSKDVCVKFTSNLCMYICIWLQPLIKPYLQPGIRQITDGANFASAGAGALVETHRGLVINLKTQLRYFNNVERRLKQKLVDAEAENMLSRAVYLINIGGNDYLSPSFDSSSPKEYVAMVIGNFTSVIQEIYKRGGRKFGFLSVLPLGCLPSTRIPGKMGSCNEEFTTMAKLHNKALSELLERLEGQLKGFKYSKFNAFLSFTQRMNHPTRYGMLL